jgi:NADH-quinone oxidoreductase subunit L
VLFSLAPAVMTIVAIVGALTLLLAGFSGITQWDIKRVLAYSTISQIGYMVLALGVGAWSAAIFHFMIHAFFKALLFLGAGVVILAMHHDHDMFHMGGLRRQMPFTFWTFLIGAASLSALPVITAGFYSKDLILWQTYASEQGSTVLYAAGLLGALLTSLYSFRMVFLTFFGAAKTEADYTPKLPIKIPLFILAALSLLAGFLEIPSTYGNLPFFTDFLHHTLPAAAILPSREGTEALSEIISGLVSVGGVALAYLFFLRAPQFATDLVRTPVGGFLHRWWFAGWGFDQLYDWVFVRPYIWLAQVNKDDIIDRFFDGVAALAQMANRALSASQTGRVRWYAAGIAVGAIISIALAVFL